MYRKDSKQKVRTTSRSHITRREVEREGDREGERASSIDPPPYDITAAAVRRRKARRRWAGSKKQLC